MNWIYQGELFKPEQIGDAVGFVYVIVNLKTDKRYIGKKLFTFAKTRGPLKGKTRKRRSRIMSDWESYYGSNKELQADVDELGAENFSRTILTLCKTKGLCSYYEIKHIIESEALLRDNFYNQWVSCKITRSHLLT